MASPNSDGPLSPAERRIRAAVSIAMRYGSIDGAHHKQWVIDQMLRKLMGAVAYRHTMRHFNTPEHDAWDVGIAP